MSSPNVTIDSSGNPNVTISNVSNNNIVTISNINSRQIYARSDVSFFNQKFVNTGELIDSSREYNYVDTGSLNEFNQFFLNSIEVNTDCRVRLYNSINEDDLIRRSSLDAPTSAGLIAEAVLTANQHVELNPSLLGSVSRLSNSGQNIMIGISPTGSIPISGISGKLDVIQIF